MVDYILKVTQAAAPKRDIVFGTPLKRPLSLRKRCVGIFFPRKKPPRRRPGCFFVFPTPEISPPKKRGFPKESSFCFFPPKKKAPPPWKVYPQVEVWFAGPRFPLGGLEGLRSPELNIKALNFRSREFRKRIYFHECPPMIAQNGGDFDTCGRNNLMISRNFFQIVPIWVWFGIKNYD